MSTHSPGPGPVPAPAGGQSPKSVTVPEQLKTGFKAGTAARSGTKKIGANAKNIAGTIVGVMLLIWATFAFIPHLKEEVSKADAEKSASTSPTTHSQKGHVQLTGSWSESVRVPGGRCIYFWQEDSNTPSHKTEVQVHGSNSWTPLATFLSQSGPKNVSHVHWSGTGTLAYELRPDGQCN